MGWAIDGLGNSAPMKPEQVGEDEPARGIDNRLRPLCRGRRRSLSWSVLDGRSVSPGEAV